MKKKLSILMAVIMAFTMLTACAVGGNASGEKTKYYWLTDMTQYRDGSERINRESISAEDPRVAAAFTYEEIAPYIIVNENYEASLTLPDEMWIDNDGVRTVCIVKVMEDPLGINYEIYECENHAKELEMLLYDVEMDQYAHLYGTAGNQTPVVDGTTPDEGSSEQTPAPAPEPAPTNGFEGVYWVTNMAYGEEGQRKGFYLDGKGKYVFFNTDGIIQEWEYSGLEVSSSSSGTSYLFFIYRNGESMGALEYTLANDGKLYYEWGDGWEGGLDLYLPVSKAEFYGN